MGIHDYLIDHPFQVVGVTASIFMFFILREDMRAGRHNRKLKDLNKKRENK